jgi:hypothetical protein
MDNFDQFAEDDNNLFAHFCEPSPKQRLQQVKANIAQEQTTFLQEVARFNAQPTQSITAQRFPNGFALWTY